mgnify:CR=1 FL=1
MIKQVHLNELQEIDKLRIIKWVYKNTNTFIMNTFGHVWSGRNWWEKFPVQVCIDDNGKVMALHAYTVNDKKPKTLKTYYIVTGEEHRGKGLAKLLIKNAIHKNKDKIDNYYVNTDDRSDGSIFYIRWFGNNYKKEKNDFNSTDLIFEEPIYNILNERTEKNG